MREKPILFSGSMVNAILDGKKTQMRRVIKPQPPEWIERFGYSIFTPNGMISGRGISESGFSEKAFTLPWQVGDHLWVRETWMQPPTINQKMLADGADTWPDYVYMADKPDDIEQLKEWGWKVKPSIYMPRWASRITLEITNIKAERLQEISLEDAMKEGFPYCEGFSPVTMPITKFQNVWSHINGKKHPWKSNPWVWVIEFKKVI